MKSHLILLALSALLASCGGGSETAAGTRLLCETCTHLSGGAASGASGFSQGGTGANVLVLPASVSLVRIRASTKSTIENFAVRADGRLIVNELIGTAATPPEQDGTYSVPAGATLEIFEAENTSWTITAATVGQPQTGGPFSKLGAGAAVFDLPTKSARYAVRANYSGTAENFAVLVAGRLKINSVIGSASSQPSLDGVYLFEGGRVEVKTSPGVTWSFSELL